MSMRTICDMGTSAAPKTPWSRRAATICASETLSPHNAEATVKPITDTRKTLFWPNRSTIQPVNGVAIAAATMYAVNTQAIWS